MVQSEAKMTPNPHFYMPFSCDDNAFPTLQGVPAVQESWNFGNVVNKQ